MLNVGNCQKNVIVFKMGQPRPIFHLALSSQTHITIFTTNKCEKCPSSTQRRDLNSQPLEHESPPITTRPGLPAVPMIIHVCRLITLFATVCIFSSFWPTTSVTRLGDFSKNWNFFTKVAQLFDEIWTI